MRQIIEETLGDGSKQWRVVTDRCFFGLFHCKWRTEYYQLPYYVEYVRIPAVFKTLEAAEIFVYGKPEDKVIERRVLAPQKTTGEI